MIIKQALKEDLREILTLQKLAYQSEAEIYNDYSIPPLIQTLDKIKEDFSVQFSPMNYEHKPVIESVDKESQFY